MTLYLTRHADGSISISVKGVSYGVPRTFGWYSDAVSVLFHNYSAKFVEEYKSGHDTVEIWKSVTGETLHKEMI